MANPRWIERLKQRWRLESAYQVIIILIVFACTGFTIFFLKRPLLKWIGWEQENTIWASVLYYLFILPLYNILLLGYGFVFGQFSFFWGFEKRFVERFFSILKRKKN